MTTLPNNSHRYSLVEISPSRVDRRMIHYVDPATLQNEPLRLKRMADAEYAVLITDFRAGRIMASMASGMTTMWTWTITGPYVPAELQPSHGDEETLEAAKNAFKAKFDAWLAWAKRQGLPAMWYH